MKHFNRSGVYIAVMSALLSYTTQAADGTDIGTINVQGQSLGGGQMVQEESAKARSTVTKEAMEKMSGTSNAVDKLKYTPGINVNSNDSTGLGGLDFTMRGMSADQVGLSMDGIPVNDSGNYALYPNLLGDPENIEEVFVTQGSSEADGPHIGSSGGNIGLVTRRPAKEFGGFLKQTIGSNNLSKTFARLDTGEYNGFSNWISYSHTEAKKWRGEGRQYADKFELNSNYEDDNGNSSNLVVKYHRQDNISYYTMSKKDFDTHGRRYDSSDTPSYNNGQISSYYKLARNPFENLTLSFTQKLQLRDNLALTLQPYYYWGNGGGASPSASYLTSSSSTADQYDLSNLSSDRTYFYRPSWTQTWRPGITSKLKWDINEQHSLDLGYWYERARQRQTQPYTTIQQDGNPSTVWAEPGASNQFTDANGNTVQGRNYFTITPAQKVWLQDTWFVSPDWTLVGGLAYQNVKRDGTNYGSLTEAPEKRKSSYSEWLPNFSISYKIDQQNQAFYNLTRNMRTPQNYVLYNKGDSISLAPEMSWNHELGYRFQNEDMLLSASLFYMRYSNRQISSSLPDGSYEMINAGNVESKGLQLEWGGNLPHNFNYYTSYTYTDSEQKQDVEYKGVAMPTSGKQLPNVPKSLLNLSLGYDDSLYYGSISSKYVSSFYGDMANNEKISGRTVVDLAAGVHLPVDKKIIKSATLRFGINNLFDKEYLSSARTIPINAQSYGGVSAGTAYYNVGEERTYSVSLEASF